MKNTLKTIAISCNIVFVSLISCIKENSNDNSNWVTTSSNIYTIPGLINAINLSNYKCGDTIKETGKYAYVTGYIQGFNVFNSESRFLTYSARDNSISAVFNGVVIETKVYNTDSSKVFSEIKSILNDNPDTIFQSVKLKVELFGWDMEGNTSCNKALGFICHDISKVE
jgi:hypothetical protein